MGKPSFALRELSPTSPRSLTENVILNQEREILKEATAFFAEHSR